MGCPVWRRQIGSLFALYNRESREGGASLFFLLPNDRIHGNDTKLHKGRFRPGIRNCFSTVRMIKH